MVVDTSAVPGGAPRGLVALDALLGTLGIVLVPLTAAGARHALGAYDRFGADRGAPPAVLNYGDCLADGVAADRGAPLLYKGDDFARTDVGGVAY